MADDNVSPFRPLVKPADPGAGGGGGFDDGGVSERVARIEAILPNLATKEDIGRTTTAIAEAKATIVMFGATLGVALAAVIVGILLFAINRVVPPSAATAPVSQPVVIQPIVIQVPAPAAPLIAPPATPNPDAKK